MRLLLPKLAKLVIVLFVVTLFSFLLVRVLPGEPEQVIIPFGSDEQRAALREDLGLDDPLHEQYASWLGGLVQGDLGNYYSVSSSRPVSDRVGDALPVSLQLMVYAQLLALVVAIPMGVFSAYRANKPVDKAANAAAFGMLAIPNFALGLVLAYYLGVQLEWFPPTGYTAPEDDFVEHIRQMVMPAIALAVGQIAVYMRLLRSDMIQTLQEDFILMAKSKGITNARVLWRHALRPSSLTLLTVAGLNVGALIGGAVVIEVVFSLPGMGLLIAQAIGERQYVALQSAVAIIAIGYVLINVFIDFLYSVLDPRIRNVRTAR